MSDVRQRVLDALARGLRPAMAVRAAAIGAAPDESDESPIELVVFAEPGSAEGVFQQVEVALEEIGSLESVEVLGRAHREFTHNEASPMVRAQVIELVEDALADLDRANRGLAVLFDKDNLLKPGSRPPKRR
jgi:hypothetical protein